mgnify:CR=1 FL=1
MLLNDAKGAKLDGQPVRSIHLGSMPILPGITNLATNPGFETTSGVVEVRRNLATDPLGASPLGTSWARQWFGTSGAGTYTQAPSGRGVRKTWTTGGTQSWDNGVGPNIVQTLPAGDKLSVSLKETIVACPNGLPPTGSRRLHVGFLDAGGGSLGAQYGPSVTFASMQIGVPVEYRLDGITIPAGAARVVIYPQETAYNAHPTAIGTIIDTTDPVVEIAPIAGVYFAPGIPSPDPDLTPAWIGAANSSQSVLTGLGVVGGPGSAAMYVGYVRCVSSQLWHRSGSRSARLIPSSASNDSRISPGGDGGALRLGMLPGRTYTALGTIRLTAPQTGTLSSLARRIVVYTHSGVGYVPIASSQPPNVAGEHEVRLTFTVPATATEAFVRLYNGASAGNGDVWWDDFMLVEGEYTGPYRDGDSPGWVWNGTAHGSTSQGLG